MSQFPECLRATLALYRPSPKDAVMLRMLGYPAPGDFNFETATQRATRIAGVGEAYWKEMGGRIDLREIRASFAELKAAEAKASRRMAELYPGGMAATFARRAATVPYAHILSFAAVDASKSGMSS